MRTPIPTLVALFATVTAATAQYGPQQSLGGVPLNDMLPFDFDADGDLDILGLQAGNFGAFVIIENLGNGTFGTPQAVTPFDVRDGHFVLADLDLDGVADLVVSESLSGSNVSWYRGLGGSAFAPQVFLGAVASAADDVAVGDLDGDGHLDLVAIGTFADDVVWFQNDGLGGFAAATFVSAVFDGPISVHLADLDGNGTLDVVVASFNDDRIAWVPNLGGGAFGPARIVSSGADGARHVITADIDDDGRLDLVSASVNDGEIAWYRNNGGGSFGSQQIIDNTAAGASSVAAVDVDQDGDLDVVAGAAPGTRWIENVGFGFFGVPEVLPGFASSPLVVLAFDADRDSDIDILSSVPAWNADLETIGASYCVGVPNSTGVVGVMSASGSTRVVQNAVTLATADLPPSVFGFFLCSRAPGNIDQPGGSQGVLCLSGGIGRFVGPAQVQFSGVSRRIRLTIDLTRTPTPTGLVAIAPGETWHFQAWHRDQVGGQATSNFSDALELDFE